jgi:integrase
MICPYHPQLKASNFRVYFQGVTKRFSSYEDAFNHLNGLRFEAYHGKFDPRDYRKDQPLGFENLANQWLKIKEQEIKKSSFRKVANHIYKACCEWRNANIKDVGFKEIQLFLISLKGLSSKTKHNHLSSLKQFFGWLKKAKVIRDLPDFPEVSFELGWRKTVDKETQHAIIGEVKRISHHINPKIWLGIRLLSTYFNLRPGELLNIKEGDIDLKQGEIIIPHPKEKKPKIVYLLEEDIELLESFPKCLLPDLHFFRHVKGNGPARPSERFGEKYLYKWWARACDNLGIEGVPLYPGTRHSTVRELRKSRTPEEIRFASMHSTNKAFER